MPCPSTRTWSSVSSCSSRGRPRRNAGRARAHEWAWRDAARVFAKADIVTAPTPYAAALAVFSGVSGPVLPISCGIDLTRFREQAPAAEFRWAYSLAPKPTMTYVGRLDAEKNLHVVMRAFALCGAASTSSCSWSARVRGPDAAVARRGTGRRRACHVHRLHP